ncbi:Putative serine peptidase S28 family protein [Zea mays]|uniref:Putative serine peptidase S28 family protein n=1 Tax=Zea mays TaxID=4577 RepID=A0A1D6GAT7_MAIZE|nr:Putative serine peptidase S28 family protein [Zea mays]
MLSRCQFNNFLHHHVENIIGSCLESNNDQLMGHVLDECKLVTRILEAEKNSALSYCFIAVYLNIFIFVCSFIFSCSIHCLKR